MLNNGSVSSARGIMQRGAERRVGNRRHRPGGEQQPRGGQSAIVRRKMKRRHACTPVISPGRIGAFGNQSTCCFCGAREGQSQQIAGHVSTFTIRIARARAWDVLTGGGGRCTGRGQRQMQHMLGEASTDLAAQTLTTRPPRERDIATKRKTASLHRARVEAYARCARGQHALTQRPKR